MSMTRTICMALALCGLGFSQTASADKTVTTHKTWVGGATTLFGRMATTGISSSSIREQGFCYGTTDMPTVDDNVTKAYIDNNGRIYKMTGLTPATVYHIRAYVKTTSGDIIYGQSVKAITRPQVNGVSYGLRDGFPDAALTRIKAAAAQAQQLWNEYTGISGLYVNIGYGADTPTADCSYGGWMRVGPNASYQATGTLLHEMLHAIGVGTVSEWNNSSYFRQNVSSGYWYGSRATRVLRFWDNDNSAYLKGDKTHMWPYGVNGAHEDTKTDKLYIGNSLLAEALGEDGLPTTTSQFAIPAYVFEQEDTVKYYIKNESEDKGLYTSYLSVAPTGTLQWMAKSGQAVNDSSAWYITFDPATCYYSLKNVATGKYISYKSTGTNGFVAKQVDTPTADEKLHFLPACVDPEGGNRGFWIGRVQSNAMTVLAALNNKTTGGSALSLTASASAQRWLILTGDEVKTVEARGVEMAKKQLETVLAHIDELAAVPHVEDEAGADAALAAAVADIKAAATASTSRDELLALVTTAETAMHTFLVSVTPQSAAQPFDLTFMLQNPGLDASDGWSQAPNISNSCGEFFEKTFDMNQTLKKMPKGTYVLKAQGFQRPGTSADAYADYAAGKDKVTTKLYLNSTSVKVKNIMADAQAKKLGSGTEVAVGGLYVPNNMQACRAYFDKGLYDNSVVLNIARDMNLKMGVSCVLANSSYWSIFDNFRLYFYGTKTKDEVAAIHTVTAPTAGTAAPQGVYTFSGVLLSKDASVVDQLPKGLYIINGKKVIIK